LIKRAGKNKRGKEMTDDSFVAKYEPRMIDELAKTIPLGKINEVRMWIQSRRDHPIGGKGVENQILVINGPAGSGKSILSRLLLQEEGYLITTLDRAESIDSIYSLATCKNNLSSLFSPNSNTTKNAIIMEDIALWENFNVSEFTKLLTLHKSSVATKLVKERRKKEEKTEEKKKRVYKKRKLDYEEKNRFSLPCKYSIPIVCPIICTNVPMKYGGSKKTIKPAFKKFLENCRVIWLDGFSHQQMSSVLKDICLKEGIEIEKKYFDKIILNSEGDIRRMLNTLQFHCESVNTIHNESKIHNESNEKKIVKFKILASTKTEDVTNDIFQCANYLLKNSRELIKDKSLKKIFKFAEMHDKIIDYVRANYIDGVKDTNSMKMIQGFYGELSQGDSKLDGFGNFYKDKNNRKLMLAGMIHNIKLWKKPVNDRKFDKFVPMKKVEFSTSLAKKNLEINNFLISLSSSLGRWIPVSFEHKRFLLEIIQSRFISIQQNNLQQTKNDKKFLKKYKLTDEKVGEITKFIDGFKSDKKEEEKKETKETKTTAKKKKSSKKK
jgi:DNA polymerase III delta prime subunit